MRASLAHISFLAQAPQEGLYLPLAEWPPVTFFRIDKQ